MWKTKVVYKAGGLETTSIASKIRIGDLILTDRFENLLNQIKRGTKISAVKLKSDISTTQPKI